MCSRKNKLFRGANLHFLDIKSSDLIKVKNKLPIKKIRLSSTKEMEVSLLGKETKKSKKMVINCDFSNRQVFSKILLASVESSVPISFNGKTFKGRFDIIARRRGGMRVNKYR